MGVADDLAPGWRQYIGSFHDDRNLHEVGPFQECSCVMCRVRSIPNTHTDIWRNDDVICTQKRR